ncbi:nuclear cap binding complex subunit [Perkinsus chesapeaki]|uniref:Nuclear cap binding complex subunit n=1 Tax=Perkinsus chesapeaki TaxID=330153 RepID=A0A7J6ML92_PERCH|nr:nuclear cap binding complex subunit [Perkinsus chesapeaki]
MSTSSSSSSSDLTDGVYWMPETPLPLASDAIQIHQLPGEVKFTDETVQNTQDYWDNVIVPSNPKTFDGRVWGVRQWRSVGPNKLQVDLQRSWYRYQLYLHFSPRALEIPEKLNPFGCCSITLVDNGTAIMAGRRSSKVACCPNMWHLTPAGTIDIDDPVAVIKKEMLEELGIPGDPLDVRLLGLFNTGREQAYKPELVFVIDLGSMKSSGVLAGVKNEAVDNWEHSRIRAEEQILELFSKCGKVKKVTMGLNRFKKSPCGFCFVEYDTRDDAAWAQNLLNTSTFDDRVIRVDWDSGVSAGRQFGRGQTGDQWRDDFRDDFDPSRGGQGRGLLKALESGDGNQLFVGKRDRETRSNDFYFGQRKGGGFRRASYGGPRSGGKGGYPPYQQGGRQYYSEGGGGEERPYKRARY